MPYELVFNSGNAKARMIIEKPADSCSNSHRTIIQFFPLHICYELSQFPYLGASGTYKI